MIQDNSDKLFLSTSMITSDSGHYSKTRFQKCSGAENVLDVSSETFYYFFF